MLKTLFSSGSRIKILNIFLLHPEKEYFVRELTRLLDEQINSIRRELEAMEEIGLFYSQTKNGKKYFQINKNHLIYRELSIMFKKINSPILKISERLKDMGVLKLLVFSGHFINRPDLPVDLFLVGDIDKKKLSHYISQDLEIDDEVRFALVSEPDFLYRLKSKDPIVTKILSSSDNIVAINSIPEVCQIHPFM